jgi:hypothetical protein
MKNILIINQLFCFKPSEMIQFFSPYGEIVYIELMEDQSSMYKVLFSLLIFPFSIIIHKCCWVNMNFFSVDFFLLHYFFLILAYHIYLVTPELLGFRYCFALYGFYFMI